MDIHGLNARQAAPSLEVLGAPTWDFDARSVAVAAIRDGKPGIYRVSVESGTPEPIVAPYSTDPHWSPTGEFLVYFGPQVGVTLDLRAITRDGKDFELPKVALTRGSERIAVRRDGRALYLLRGDSATRNLVLFDLATGAERTLTDSAGDMPVADFDVAPDGTEVVLERRAESADQLLIELAGGDVEGVGSDSGAQGRPAG
jgi:Tol biopolymer transport system component